MPPSKTWKQKERDAAAKFGCLRNVLSGSAGRDDRSRSDTTHEALFIECKYREVHAARTLWEKTKALAAKEKKTPVLALADKGKRGQLFVIHEDDLETVLGELKKLSALNRSLDDMQDYEDLIDGS